jgi:hypothetical protein
VCFSCNYELNDNVWYWHAYNLEWILIPPILALICQKKKKKKNGVIVASLLSNVESSIFLILMFEDLAFIYLSIRILCLMHVDIEHRLKN